MTIIKIDESLGREKTARLVSDIADIDEAVFGDSKWGKTSFEESVSNSYDILLAAVCGGDGESITAGYALIRCLSDAELLYIAVDEKFRKKGIGQSLLGVCLTEAEKLGAESIMLEVRAGNSAAIKMYENAGFTAFGIRKGYYHAPKEDAVIMRFEC